MKKIEFCVIVCDLEVGGSLGISSIVIKNRGIQSKMPIKSFR